IIEGLSHNIAFVTALLKPLPVVVKGEVIRDGDLLRTYINTISAVCTVYSGIAVDDFDYLVDDLVFLFIEGNKVLEGLHIVIKELHFGHARQHYADAGQASHEPVGPGCNRR